MKRVAFALMIVFLFAILVLLICVIQLCFAEGPGVRDTTCVAGQDKPAGFYARHRWEYKTASSRNSLQKV